MKKHKTKIIWVEVFFVDDHTLGVISPDSTQTYSFNNAIIATGSRLIEIKGFKFGGHVLDSMGGLNLKEVPKKFVIIGGGVIDTEIGSAYANLGAEVMIWKIIHKPCQFRRRSDDLEDNPQTLPI